MTDEQVENWRRILFLQIGPYAIVMPKEEIIKIRDSMQNAVNKLPDMINGFFEENKITDEFDVTDNPVKRANCNCCHNHKPVHECTDINKKIFFLCEDCLSLAEG